MYTLSLDSNIYDRLAADQSTIDRIKSSIAQGVFRVVISPIVRDELVRSPFQGIPDFFPIELVADSVVVPGLAIPGLARPGKGDVFTAHIGTSQKQGKDALIADSASNYGDIFVSNDQRSRERLQQLGTRCKCFSYREFTHWLEHLAHAP
jgi:predicted nucleic acid-binding protein